MSRKDTIIIAVLINAGLLIVLFATALKTSAPQAEIAQQPKKHLAEPIVLKESSMQGVDELDHALAQASSSPPFTHPAPLSTAPMTNFAEDLKAFALPVLPAAPGSTAQEAVEKKGECIEIKVKKGDVLEKIARNHRSTVEEIISYNQLPSTHLRIGQTLKIPSKGAVATKTAPLASVAPAATEPKYYIVKTGDNPWTIAVKNQMKVEELLKLNNLDQEKARKLKPGDKLLIK